jgi:tricorn protease
MRCLPIARIALVLLAGSVLVAAEKPVLLERPAVSRTQIAFVYADDIWVVGREGGEARRLTAGVGVETAPAFSPDGAQIAFTGEYDGNVDVYVVAASGGVPRRLTYHPGTDVVAGWTPDGKRILFRSGRDAYSRFSRLYTVPAEGGFPSEVPLPMAYDGSYSADGASLAYMPIAPAFDMWKRYRGGRTTAIWVAKLSDSSIDKIPRQNSNDFNPMWVGNKVYFLSDRNGPVSLFAYDTAKKVVTPVLRNGGLDIKSASAAPDAIVYDQFGSLHLLDLKSGKEREVKVEIAGDLPSVRPHYEKVATRLRFGRLSPTGARALFEARGEILTVPAEKGDIRNLTRTPGAAERDPAWSPDGKQVAYFSDESGEYMLHLRDQAGLGEVKTIKLNDRPCFYFSPVWSPDSKKIAYTDNQLNVWYVDVEKGTPTKVDTDTYDKPGRSLDPVWAPDSRWLAYTKQLKNHLRAVFVYSLERGDPHRITDGMSDAGYALFDKNGKYLYFTASTDAAPTTGWLDMSSVNRPISRSVYVVVLGKDLPSPLAPESDEEKGPDAKPADKPDAKDKAKDKEKEPVKVSIDVENISQRILALPLPARNYVGMMAGKSGVLFIVEAPPVLFAARIGIPALTVHKFDLTTRKTEKFLDGIQYASVSFNGEKMLYWQAEKWAICGTGQPPKPGEGTLKIDDAEVYVDPRAEWRQMYREVWRLERDFLYDPGAHGLDLKAAEKKYEPYLDRLASRTELNALFAEMLGELSLGHTRAGGGDTPQPKRVQGGLLGADYKIENGRYRLARVYDGENWNPNLRAPLTQPGVNVKAGEYLLAVNGRDLRGSDNIYSFFEGTVGKQVLLKVGPNADATGSREVTVVPVESEGGLRNLAWIEDNRRRVEQMSQGRVAYVYLPDTSTGGYTNFNRYYFAQVDKEAAVIDERFNGGGLAADYIIDYMRRPLLNYWSTRYGADFTTPLGSIYGPKAMIINEYAGSGGDAMPWYFRRSRIGPLIGKRTWGGLVGTMGFPQLMDGGYVTAPNLAFWNPEGKWDVENHGVAPDIEVEMTPAACREGKDPQLEKAVQAVMDALKKNPPPKAKREPYPNYHKPAVKKN